MGYVYLIHFERPVNGLRHYMGYTDHFEQRILAHRSGQGAGLTSLAKEQGVPWLVVRVWRGCTYEDEKRLKDQYAKTICPICKQKAKDLETFKKRGTSRPFAKARDSEPLSSSV